MSNTLCDLCHAREASVFVSKIVGNTSSKHRLCVECARRAARADEFIDGAELSNENISLEDVMKLLRESGALELNAAQWVESPLDALMTGDLPLDLSLGEFPSDEDAVDELEDDFSDDDEFDEAPFHMESEVHDDETDPFADATPNETAPTSAEAIFGSSDANDNDFASARCLKCGTTWDRLRQDGRAGCAQCYATFATQLADVMARVQKASQHAGKAPRALEKRQRRLVHLRARRDSRLELLNRRLKESVAREKYEEAAQLRDKIKLLASTIVED